MNRKLCALAVEQCAKLGDEFFRLSQEVSKWHPEPLDDVQKARMGVEIQAAVQKQREWLDALAAEFEAEE